MINKKILFPLFIIAMFVMSIIPASALQGFESIFSGTTGRYYSEGEYFWSLNTNECKQNYNCNAAGCSVRTGSSCVPTSCSSLTTQSTCLAANGGSSCPPNWVSSSSECSSPSGCSSRVACSDKRCVNTVAECGTCLYCYDKQDNCNQKCIPNINSCDGIRYFSTSISCCDPNDNSKWYCSGTRLYDGCNELIIDCATTGNICANDGGYYGCVSISCSPPCPSPSTIQCGVVPNPYNGCYGPCAPGTKCTTGTCTDGQCVSSVCSDTDGGNYPNVKGKVTVNGAITQDTCSIDFTKVNEQYCENGAKKSQTYNCPNGCATSGSDGSYCKSCTPSCSGKVCGDDGCGGSCGSCTGTNSVCNNAGQCVSGGGECKTEGEKCTLSGTIFKDDSRLTNECSTGYCHDGVTNTCQDPMCCKSNTDGKFRERTDHCHDSEQSVSLSACNYKFTGAQLNAIRVECNVVTDCPVGYGYSCKSSCVADEDLVEHLSCETGVCCKLPGGVGSCTAHNDCSDDQFCFKDEKKCFPLKSSLNWEDLSGYTLEGKANDGVGLLSDPDVPFCINDYMCESDECLKGKESDDVKEIMMDSFPDYAGLGGFFIGFGSWFTQIYSKEYFAKSTGLCVESTGGGAYCQYFAILKDIPGLENHYCIVGIGAIVMIGLIVFSRLMK